MKQLQKFAGYLLLAVVLFTSCSKKSPTEIKYIPKDASMVFVVNQKSLNEKLKSGNLTVDSFINRIKRNADSSDNKAFALLEDFRNNGINFDDNMYLFFVQKGKAFSTPNNIFNVLGNMSDISKFETYLKNHKDLKGKTINKGEGFSYIIEEESSFSTVAIAWNKDVVLGTMYQKSPVKFSLDTTGNYENANEPSLKKEVETEIARYFNLKEQDRLTSIGHFNNMFKEKADGYLFTTSEGTLSYLKASPINIPKLGDLLKDNYSVSYFNFENGKIVANSTSYTSPMLSSILKKYPSLKINTASLEKYPSQNMNGFLQLAFNAEVLNGIVKELELSALADNWLSKVGLTTTDIVTALKGEMNLFVSDFKMEEKEVSYSFGDQVYKNKITAPSANILFTATIGNKVAFTNLMEKAVQAGFVLKTPDGNYKVAEALQSLQKMYLTVDGDKLVVASDEAIYKTYVANTAKTNLSSEILSKIKDKAAAGYINVNSLIAGSITSVNDSTGKRVLTILNNNLKYGIFTSDNFDGGAVKSNMEFILANEKQNSLVSLFNMTSEIVTIMQEEEKKRKAMRNNYMPQLNNGSSALDGE